MKIKYYFLLFIISINLILAQPAPQECTSFCLRNSGYAVFGSNYDYPKDIPEGLIFVNKRNVSKDFLESDSFSKHLCWRSKYGSVSFNLVTGQAAFAGMNEAGLVISLMGLRESKFPKPDERPWIHTSLWLQYMLDNFSTVEEVIATDSSLRTFGNVPPYFIPHYLISDKYGNCATIEFLNGKMVAHSGKNLPVTVLANSTYDQSISEWNKISVLNKIVKPAAKTNSSLRRFTRAAEMVSSYEPGDSQSVINYAFEILDQVSGQKINGSPTLWSMVFDTKSRRIFFKTINHNEIRMIDFEELDFSCQSPIKMIDINERLSGDITDKLKDYSFDIHVNHATRAAKKWKMKIKSEELRQQIKTFDKFRCESSPSK
ncbi:MAG: linear amide C-N hydrolase [Ignavibacteriales bacterium]|nr:linear amide C-N hydrolase [Ignavibacteriales bacterium]